MRLVVSLLLTPLLLSPAAQAADLSKPLARESYAFGMELGGGLRASGVKIDPAILAEALMAAYRGEQTALTREEASGILRELQEAAVERKRAEQQAQAPVNLKKSNAFLATNGKKDGVVTTASGLQYQVLKAGEGASPGPTSRVTVHYRGTLMDGETEFDSSYSRGEPASFALNQVIQGWTEGLQLMRPGGKLRLFIPPQLAYGERGAGQAIGPNEALIFDVELLSVDD